MRAFLLVPFLLAALNSLVAGAPTSTSTVFARSRGTVTLFSEPGFQGTSTTVDVWEKCSQNFAYGSVKSIDQGQGALCTYYREQNCEAGNHSPSYRAESLVDDWKWPNMEDWEGKILSFKCGHFPRARAPDSDTAGALELEATASVSDLLAI